MSWCRPDGTVAAADEYNRDRNDALSILKPFVTVTCLFSSLSISGCGSGVYPQPPDAIRYGFPVFRGPTQACWRFSPLRGLLFVTAVPIIKQFALEGG